MHCIRLGSSSARVIAKGPVESLEFALRTESHHMLKVGFGQVDITPTMGKDRSGGFANRGHWPTHDPLLAVACAIDNGTSAVALVGIDTVVVERHVADAARERIASETGIAAANVLISASHTHQGGPVPSGLFSE